MATEDKTAGGHHLILGTLTDFLTGQPLTDTHDERYRQQLARLLVAEKGYAKTDIHARCPLTVVADEKKAVVPVDFVVELDGRAAMIVKYGPGSVVTRHRPALAASRLLRPYQIAVVVATNGRDADIIDGETGRVVASGLSAIPSRPELMKAIADRPPKAIGERQVELESRIVYCFEIDDSCPCDGTVCRL